MTAKDSGSVFMWECEFLDPFPKQFQSFCMKNIPGKSSFSHYSAVLSKPWLKKSPYNVPKNIPSDLVVHG